MAHEQNFSPDQQIAHDAMKRLIASPAQADIAYDSIPDSKGGKLISTDIARLLDRRYAEGPPGQPRDLLPGWDLAWRYAQDRFSRELLKGGAGKTVRLMAGGWAAGKTHALERISEAPDLAWDGTLQDAEWAAGMIDLALSEGWMVEIAYVYRDLELAFYGAIERASKEGRTVPLEQLPRVHRNVQKTILRLFKDYFDEENVLFILLHNLGTALVEVPALQISVADVDSRGALHYTSSHERYFFKAAPHISRS